MDPLIMNLLVEAFTAALNRDIEGENSASQPSQYPSATAAALSQGTNLLPVIEPQLDKDRQMQLQALYNELKQNKISKDAFVQRMRNLVGDQMLKMVVYKLQGQELRGGGPRA